MKKLLLIFFYFLFAFNSKAQTTPWIASGAVWTYSFSTIALGGYEKIEYTGDTIILGKKCEILSTIRYNYGLSGPNATAITFLWADTLSNRFTYNSNDTVFYLLQNNFEILYIFNAQISDSWDLGLDTLPGLLCSKSFVKVDSVIGVNIGANLHRALVLKDLNNNNSIGITGRIIEHIGSMNYLFPTYRNCDPQIIAHFYDYKFLCFEDSLVTYKVVSNDECSNPWHVGIADMLKKAKLNVYPNPTAGNLNIEYPFPIISTIEVFDIYGKQIHSSTFNNSKMQIDLREYSSGIYLVRVISDDGMIKTAKIIKQ